MLRMVRLISVGTMLFGPVVAMPSLASAQSDTGATSASTGSEGAAAEDPNDKGEHERSFEETRKHMMSHSEWSKKTGKMNDN